MALPFPSFLSRLGHLGPRARKVVRYVGFVLVGLVTFVFAFQLTFPFQRVKDKIVELLSDKYDVTIGDVEGGLIPGRMFLKAVSLRTRPTSASETATTFYVEKLEIDIGLLALLRGTASVKLDAKIGPGRIKGTIALSKDDTSIDLVGEDLPSASLPVREALGLPMSGKVRFAFDLDLPNEKNKAGKVVTNWPKATGGVELACPSGCTVGDGKSKLKPNLRMPKAQQAFAEGGIDFGKVTVDNLVAAAEIKNGKLDVTKFDVKSADGDLRIELDVALNQDLMSSTVAGCLKFTVSEALGRREPKTYAAINTTGAPRGPDGLFHIKLDGPLREVRRLGVVCTPGGSSDSGGVTPRPNLTITPENPTGRPAMIPPPTVPTIPPPQTPTMPITEPPSPPVQVPLDAGAASIRTVPPGAEGEQLQPAAPPGQYGAPPGAQPPQQTPGSAIAPPAGSSAPQ
jgi:type II secretion system protein N